jgi:signal transduction histidine kinase
MGTVSYLPVHEFQDDIDAVARIAAVPTILAVLCATTGMGFAAVARVTEGRWVACGVKDEIGFGLTPGGELRVETTICHEIRQVQEPVIINHVAEDLRYRSHPTPAMYGFQSYISMPILLANGSFFGTLCAIDPKPHMLATPQVTGMFKLFAELIAFHLDAHARIDQTEARLSNEIETAKLRDQFIAVLGHDLRNPLASIEAGSRLLLKAPLDERTTGIVTLIRSSVSRMSGLIDDVLDFARGRLGGGLPLNRHAAHALDTILNQVVEELRSSHPDRAMDTDIALTEPVECDPDRIAQLFSNLLANALTHGVADSPVRARVRTEDGQFLLSVSNAGEPIPRHAIGRLFQPFFRGGERPTQQGLGLGLYIVSEIASAHGGTVDVTSTPTETRFTFQMPCRPQ